MDRRTVARLENVYEHVDDIDLFPGGMAEKPVVGGIVGRSQCVDSGSGHELDKESSQQPFAKISQSRKGPLLQPSLG